MKTLQSMVIISLLLLLTAVPVLAVNINGEVRTEFSYAAVDEGLPPAAKSKRETNSNSYLNLDISGLYKTYQYNLEVEGQGQDFSGQIKQATLSTTFGPTLWEVGKREWNWGEGFSLSPTCPFKEDTVYSGLETSLMFKSYNLAGGGVVDDSGNLYSSWLRFNSLLSTSDYAVIASYLKDNSQLDNSIGQQETGLNLGVNYSKDFLTGLEIHGGINFRKWETKGSWEEKYLLGAQYNTANQKIITLEYYRKQDDYLTCVVRNQGRLTSDWNWEVQETVNLADYGQIRSLDLSYTGWEKVTPKLEITEFVGPEDSQIKQKPEEWKAKFKVIADLF